MCFSRDAAGQRRRVRARSVQWYLFSLLSSAGAAGNRSGIHSSRTGRKGYVGHPGVRQLRSVLRAWRVGGGRPAHGPRSRTIGIFLHPFRGPAELTPRTPHQLPFGEGYIVPCHRVHSTCRGCKNSTTAPEAAQRASGAGERSQPATTPTDSSRRACTASALRPRPKRPTPIT